MPDWCRPRSSIVRPRYDGIDTDDLPGDDGRMRTSAWTWLLAIAVLLAPSLTHAAPARYDLMSYQAPKGWTVDTSKGVLTIQRVDLKKQTFAVILVAHNSESAGSLDRDFQAAWDTLIIPGFKVTDPPQMTPAETENGWQAKSGTAQGEANGAPAAVILVTGTGHGRTLNIVITTNSEAYTSGIQSFLSSVKMQKPSATTTTDAAPAPTPAPAPAPATAKSGGPTTTFDDGWTSMAETDWVRVTRPDATVYLHHAVALDDASRQDPAEHFWNKLVEPRYALSNKIARGYSAVNFPYYFVQADATDRATKATGYVSLRVVTSNGVASCIEVFTPSRDAFTKLFPDQDKLAAITGANRFVIGKDIAGTWSSTTSGAINMYYVATGGSAGMNAASIADKFSFAASGSFTSEHKGATGMIGNQKTFNEKYKGTYAVSAWDLTVKRSDGTSSDYSAYYEAVRGGWVLHLQDKKYSGSTYALVRAK